MAASLIGYMVKGPLCMPLKQEAMKWFERKAKLGKDWPELEDKCPENLKEIPVIVGVSDSGEDMDRAHILTESGFSLFVDKFYRVWGKGSKDSASRIDPDNPERKIVFAGCPSWGDEPDGLGYEVLKIHEIFGFGEFTGVK